MARRDRNNRSTRLMALRYDPCLLGDRPTPLCGARPGNPGHRCRGPLNPIADAPCRSKIRHRDQSSKARCHGGQSDRKQDSAKVWGRLTAYAPSTSHTSFRREAHDSHRRHRRAGPGPSNPAGFDPLRRDRRSISGFPPHRNGKTFRLGRPALTIAVHDEGKAGHNQDERGSSQARCRCARESRKGSGPCIRPTRRGLAKIGGRLDQRLRGVQG